MKNIIFSDISKFSVPFIWPDKDALSLVQLRLHLKETFFSSIQVLPTTLSKMQEICGKTLDMWEHDGSNIPEKFDPQFIIEEAKKGNKFRCVEYAYVASALGNAYGIQSRSVGLQTEDVETREMGAGHVVIEYWDKEFSKWVLIDVQCGIIPFCKGIPLSAVELCGLLENNSEELNFKLTASKKIDPNKKAFMVDRWKNWIGQYLYYFSFSTAPYGTTSLERLTRKQVMLTPLGAHQPKVFQKKDPIVCEYTDCVADVYPRFS